MIKGQRLSAYDLSVIIGAARKSGAGDVIVALVNEIRDSREALGENPYVPVGFRVSLDGCRFNEHQGDDIWVTGFSL